MSLVDPKLPSPSEPYVDGVKVIDFERDPDGDVYVTFARAGGSPVKVRVPWLSWVNGEHSALARHLAQQLPPATVVPPAGDTQA